MAQTNTLNRIADIRKRVGRRGLISLIVLIALVLLALNRPQTLDTNQITLIVLFFLTVLWLITVFVGLRNRTGSLRTWLVDYSKDISPELFGAILTTILFTVIVGGAQQSQAEAELKAQLIRQLGSHINVEAIRAAEELTGRGWLFDGTTQGVFLSNANLQGAILERANFRGANFFEANLSNAQLDYADLQGAFFNGANLQGADFLKASLQSAGFFLANLQGANLGLANLQGATFSHADLEAVNFIETNLQDVSLENAVFDENTTLPDGTQWTPNSDLARFTNPVHPNFWRSNNPCSPAYSGDGTCGGPSSRV